MTQDQFNKLCQNLIMYVPQIEPFFFVAPMKVMPTAEYKEKFSSENPTAHCSAKEFIFSSDFMDSLSEPKQHGLILHEVLHGALFHITDPWIDKTLTPESFHRLANIAKDYAIENLILEMSALESQNAAFEDRRIMCNYEVTPAMTKYAGWSWRDIYRDLLEKNPPKPNPFDSHAFGEGSDSHAFGEGSDSDEGTPSSVDGEYWKAAAKESKRISEDLAKQAGSQSGIGSLQIKPEEPVIRWQDVLKNVLVSIPTQTSRSWATVKRRPFAMRREYVPVLRGEMLGLEHIYLFIDTSGSMHDTLGKVAGDVLNLLRELQVEKLSVIFYDVNIQRLDEVEGDDLGEYSLKEMPNGGGTCVRLAMEELVQRPDFDAGAPCVVLTDGYDDYSVGSLPLGPLVWLSYEAAVVSDVGISIQVEK